MDMNFDVNKVFQERLASSMGLDKYQYIKNTFGVEPYYLNDGSFIVVLENECNQRTLDKLVKGFENRRSE